MGQVSQAMQAFVASLDMTEKETADASGQQNRLRESLRVHLAGVERDLLVGSYARKTAIRPLKDIDVFMVLRKDTFGGYLAKPPAELLNRVSNALVAAYPSHKPRIQARSVNIEFTGTDIGYDVIPAFEEAADVFQIPDRAGGTWIRTNPTRHRDVLVAANQRVGGMLNPIIKAAKSWNSLAGKPLKSFHLEALSYTAFPTSPVSLASGIATLLSYAAANAQADCKDPAGLGPPVNATQTSAERLSASQLLVGASRKAQAALTAENASQFGEAVRLWRELLGPRFGA